MATRVICWMAPKMSPVIPPSLRTAHQANRAPAAPAGSIAQEAVRNKAAAMTKPSRKHSMRARFPAACCSEAARPWGKARGRNMAAAGQEREEE